MDRNGRGALASAALLASVLVMVSGCRSTSTPVPDAARDPGHDATYSTAAVVAGTRIDVVLVNELSSETANVGDAWRGCVTADVATLNGGMILAGSPVEGVVAVAIPARTGARGMLQLGVRTIRVNGHDELIAAITEPVLAGSLSAGGVRDAVREGYLRARKADAVERRRGGGPGGALARSVLLAPSVRTGRDQIVLPDGTILRFRVRESVAMR